MTIENKIEAISAVGGLITLAGLTVGGVAYGAINGYNSSDTEILRIAFAAGEGTLAGGVGFSFGILFGFGIVNGIHYTLHAFYDVSKTTSQ